MSASAPAANPSEPRKESLRDTVESIVFAFILAFLFRTFEAEAFVIPTGSMAPTLYGRHKEADCSQCGAHILVGASDEYDADAGVLKPGSRLEAALCPSCRYPNTQLKDALAFNGDRILVNKFPYEIGEPKRWDVFVFKYPEEPDMNYIKRLVGLPGETIRIRQGDLYLWDGTEEQILRKPDPNKQRVLQMLVYDDNHPPRELIAAGWPERWVAAVPSSTGVGGWQETTTGWARIPESRVLRIDSKAPAGLNWLRYRHFVPYPLDWEQLEAHQPLQPAAELISDFCGYNTAYGPGLETSSPRRVDTGAFWVGDLTVNFTLDITEAQPDGKVVVELREGVYIYRCHLDVAGGTARLSEINQALDPTLEKDLAEAPVNLRSSGTSEITFSNVDDRLCLWVNDTLADFGEGAILSRSGATGLPLPQKSDLSPAGIATQGIVATVKDLTLERDVYYRATVDRSQLEVGLADRLDAPEQWSSYYQSRAEDDFAEIQTDPDGFLALGDNSPRSRDSRAWADGLHSVPRNHLVGQAFYIYWPHGVPFLNDGRGFGLWNHKDGNGKSIDNYPKWSIPFYPQVSRMKRIR